MFSDYQVVSLKNTKPFRDLHTRRCLALRFWEVVRIHHLSPSSLIGTLYNGGRGR